MSRVVDISVRHTKTKVSAVSVQRVVHALDGQWVVLPRKA